jgi:hypothetical protein
LALLAADARRMLSGLSPSIWFLVESMKFHLIVSSKPFDYPVTAMPRQSEIKTPLEKKLKIALHLD